ncbi:MAG: ribbon-helix-helix domain-containing protein [Acidimicrobiia bacterium]
MSTTIRINEATRARLALLAASTGLPMTRLLDEAVEVLERKVFFNSFNERYGALRADKVAWAEIEEERLREDGAVADTST